ncbi:MAG: mRNA cleavage and polyadenylation factor subunit [Alyxoria varia]|nr:MAG: mRNA cleavage and polyadenylation factor subunit [Alyxoria varia]
MQSITQLVPPSAVSHAICCPFVSANSNNLIVARASLLQIFRVEVAQNAKTSDTKTHVNEDHFKPHKKLVLISEYHVSGTICSIASVKLPVTLSGGHALLVAVKDAKMVLIDWEPETFCVNEISLHLYEDEDDEGPCDARPGEYQTYLTMDPGNRCAALKFEQNTLAILPFKQPGDDLVDEEYDSDLDGPRPDKAKPTENEKSNVEEDPYLPSFELPISLLDPTLAIPLDVKFLYEYREPTLGVLSADKDPADSWVKPDRREYLKYTVYTLDLKGKARTPLVSVTGLPSDLWKIIPLPLPIGGSLLIGANVVVHVDPSGKTNAVAVNEFAKRAPIPNMVDQSRLEIALEGSVLQMFNTKNGDMLIVLGSGDLALLTFKLDGRSLSGLSVKLIPEENGGHITGGRASCSCCLDQDLFFIGSDVADSMLLSWHRVRPQLSRKRSDFHNEDDMMSDDDIDDDDDLYDDEEAKPISNRDGEAQNSVEDLLILESDRLRNYAPKGEPTFGFHTRLNSIFDSSDPNWKKPDFAHMIYPSACGSLGGVTLLGQQITTVITQEFQLPKAENVWIVSISNQDDLQEYTEYLILSHKTQDEPGQSSVYELSAQGLRRVQNSEFEEDISTLFIGTLVDGTQLVQISPAGARSYDRGLKTCQLLAMFDENEETELKVIHASFLDPFLVVVRDDYSILVLKADSSGELDVLPQCKQLKKGRWVSSSIHRRTTEKSEAMLYLLSDQGAMFMYALPNLAFPVSKSEGLPHLPSFVTTEAIPKRFVTKTTVTEILVADIGTEEYESTYLLARTADGEVQMYEPFHVSGAPLDTLQVQDLRWRRLRHSHLPKMDQYDEDEEKISTSSLTPIKNIDGYSVVFIRGNPPSLILREPANEPRSLPIRGENISALCGYSSTGYGKGFAMVDNEHVKTGNFMPNTRFSDLGWEARQISLNETVEAITYHFQSELYILGTTEPAMYKVPEDDPHHDWANETTTFLPRTNCGRIKLLDPRMWAVIDDYPLEPLEIVTCMRTVSLEVSEVTHERKLLVAVGTAIIGVEDVSTMGHIHVFEIVQVVPEPGKPETGRKLHLLVREEVRGAVTALSEITGKGFLMMSQGQKLMVRGLKEDGTFLPMAFLDLQGYLSVLKNLKGTGMALMADSLQGVSLHGFDVSSRKLHSSFPISSGGTTLTLFCVMLEIKQTEPYRWISFSKSMPHIGVIASEMLPHEKQLYIVIADTEGDVHIVEYHPECRSFLLKGFFSSPEELISVKPDPKTFGGQRLLHRSAFHVGHFPVSMTLLPGISAKTRMDSNQANHLNSNRQTTEETLNDDTDRDSDQTTNANGAKRQLKDLPPDTQQVMLMTRTGAVFLVSALSEASYRRLTALQSYLLSMSSSSAAYISPSMSLPGSMGHTLHHPLGLNHREYRAPKQVERDPTRGVYGVLESGSGGAVPGGRGGLGAGNVLDGGILRRWSELGGRARSEAWARVFAADRQVGESEAAVLDRVKREVEWLSGDGICWL